MAKMLIMTVGPSKSLRSCVKFVLLHSHQHPAMPKRKRKQADDYEDGRVAVVVVMAAAWLVIFVVVSSRGSSRFVLLL